MTFEAAWRAAPAMGGSMPTGERVRGHPTFWTMHRLAARRRQRGFTYLWLLFVLAIGAAGLAGLGQSAGAAAHRDREAELMFRGQAIADAISSYWSATPGEPKRLPATLDELLDDRRGPRPVHHLRRVYPDPFTGRTDWELLRDETGRIAGVRSRADVAAMRVADLPLPAAGRSVRVSDRVFMFQQSVAAVGAAASAGATGHPAHPPDRAASAEPD